MEEEAGSCLTMRRIEFGVCRNDVDILFCPRQGEEQPFYIMRTTSLKTMGPTANEQTCLYLTVVGSIIIMGPILVATEKWEASSGTWPAIRWAVNGSPSSESFNILRSRRLTSGWLNQAKYDGRRFVLFALLIGCSWLGTLSSQ